jgi:hypothetical protein
MPPLKFRITTPFAVIATPARNFVVRPTHVSDCCLKSPATYCRPSFIHRIPHMHTVILISGDDVPAGGFVVGADQNNPALDQLIHDLRQAYPRANHRVISGLDVVTDVAEAGE